MRKTNLLSVVVFVVVLITVMAFTCAACDSEVTCPMHHISSQATGREKFTDDGQKHWAEYRCPGLPTGDATEPPHTFWVECN